MVQVELNIHLTKWSSNQRCSSPTADALLQRHQSFEIDKLTSIIILSKLLVPLTER